MPDLLRSAFNRGPVRVESAGDVYVFPYESAAQWIGHLTAPHWVLSVMQGADPDSHDRLMDRLECGEAQSADVDRVAHAALTEAAGRPWWEAQRLALALREPALLGTVLKTCDPHALSLAALLAVVYATLTTGASTADRMKIEAEIAVPPPGVEGDDEESMADMVDRMRSMPGVRVG